MGDREFSSDNFKEIEDKMLELARNKADYERKAISKADAEKYFTEKGDEYKLDLIKDLARFGFDEKYFPFSPRQFFSFFPPVGREQVVRTENPTF